MFSASSTHHFWAWLPCGRGYAVAVCAVLTSLLVGGGELQAAGCHYGNDADSVQVATPGAMPAWPWATSKHVVRRYDGGQFTYYPAPNGPLPCQGPHCNGTPPSDTSCTSTATLELSRQSLTCSSEVELPWELPIAGRNHFFQPLHWASPTLAGPLRPPRG